MPEPDATLESSDGSSGEEPDRPDTGLGGGSLIFDDLSGSGALAGRMPSVGPPDTLWEEEVGNWFVTADGVGENSGLVADLRAFMQLPERAGVVSVDIQLNGGLAGLVLRYTDDTDWLMVWLNGEIDTLNAGMLANRAFTLVLNVPFAVGTGEVGAQFQFRNLSVVDQGDLLIVLVDDEEIASVEVPGGFVGTGVGIFNRVGTNNLFRNFTTEPRQAQE